MLRTLTDGARSAAARRPDAAGSEEVAVTEHRGNAERIGCDR